MNDFSIMEALRGHESEQPLQMISNVRAGRVTNKVRRREEDSPYGGTDSVKLMKSFKDTILRPWDGSNVEKYGDFKLFKGDMLKEIRFNALWSKIYALWKQKMLVHLKDIQNDYYLAKFQATEDYTKVLTEGPWAGSFLNFWALGETINRAL
ncbi:hypothetical protein Golax_025564 [Gossypium laxum]|uniref:DUF4283 domain-containing protein n=1 Tax=Gossypium laxum TaxID=34288 RepID=A0A7J9B2Z7_9ROSI|nr:hypothetical protein [Gossypium laxum]